MCGVANMLSSELSMPVSSVRIAVVAVASSALIVSVGVVVVLSVDLLQAANATIAASARMICFIVFDIESWI